MKALLFSGLLLAAIPLHSVVMQASTQDFSLTGFEQQLQQDLNKLESLFGSPDVSQQQINQQLNQVMSDVQQLNQHMAIQAMLNRRGIRHLPKQGNFGQHTVGNGLQVAAGDRRVSQATLQMAANLVQKISLSILQQNVGSIPASGTKLVLFSSRQTYGQALLKAGVPQNEIQSVVSNTGGLTIGNDVWIPLYNLQGQADLANVLTHELTHVIFNQKGIGDTIPTWVNEGMAWHDGMLALQQVSPSQAQQQADELNQQVQQAKASGQLLPLSASESDILQAPYNVEWTDYLAVQHLIQQNGVQKMDQFLNDLKHSGVDQSFQATFGDSISTYENNFIQSL